MKLEYIPGWLLLIAVAVASEWVSSLVEIGSKHPLEASAVAIVVGIAIKNAGLLPASFLPGVRSSEKLLALGIVFMGAALNLSAMAGEAPALLIIVVATLLSGLLLIAALGKLFNLPKNLAVLLAVGTAICGTSAIAITAPLIRAKEEETSYAIGTVALWGLAAILIYPEVARLLNVSDLHFGLFAGTAIHSTPQVVGAGFIYSDLSGQTATSVKLIRNCFMAPLAILIALMWNRSAEASAQSKVSMAAAFPWFLFGYFVLAWCNTSGYFTPAGIGAFSSLGKFLILLGMAGVGLTTSLSAFRSVGVRPLIVGFLGALVLAGVSALLISAFAPA